MVNQKRAEYGLRATVEATGGSVFNINAVLSGDLEFGVAQSDRQYQALNGLAEWADKGPQQDLRAVFSLHPEIVTLMAAVDAGVKSVTDLKGKRVNLGNPGSGTLQNAIDALTAVGIDHEKDIKPEGIKAAEAPGLLQDGRIDAFFYTVGHPSGAFKEATAGARKVLFVPLEGPGVDELIKAKPFYAKAVLPVMANYQGAANTEDVNSFGVLTTLVTSAKVPDDVVYAITREVFENLDSFKSLHPAFATLTKESMLEGMSAPIHSGAMKYFKEAGLK
jgi:hypothetical protein